jgi:hypothetical protein
MVFNSVFECLMIILLILLSFNYQVVERDGLKRELKSFLNDFEAVQRELNQTRMALKQNEDQIRTSEGSFIWKFFVAFC